MQNFNGIYKGHKTLSIMPTYQCTAECKYCGTLSSPREKIHNTLKDMLSAIKQAKELNFANVVFTGGEPFLRWKDLLNCISYSNSLGFPTRVVTNAYWATSLTIAKKKLDELIEAGLTEINYSTGDEHIRFVPEERIINATIATLEKNLRLNIMIELRAGNKIKKDFILNNKKVNFLHSKNKKMLKITESPWMPLDPFHKEKYPIELVANRDNVEMRTGCDSVLQTYMLQADGKISSCCGLEMRSVSELHTSTVNEKQFLSKAIEKSENDFFKVGLRYTGPEKILAWAAEKDPNIKWENMYAHRCQACMRLYKDPNVKKIIYEHYAEKLLDVLQRVWIEEEFIPDKLKNLVKNKIA